MMKTVLAVHLSDVLKRSGMTQKDLAVLAGVTPSYISQILAGKKRPTLTTLSRMCEALNVRMEDMIAEEDPPKPSSQVLLTRKELDLLTAYRSLLPSDQWFLERIIRLLPKADQCVQK